MNLDRVRRAHPALAGFSMVELLVVVAIIAIIAAFYMSSLGKALRAAKQLRNKEGIRQENIGRMADNANIARPSQTIPPDAELRAQCRAAFRRWVDVGREERMCITEMLFVVQSTGEFLAYYHTLVNPNNDAPIERNGAAVVVQDPDGNRHTLQSRSLISDPALPVLWEYLANDPQATTMNGQGIDVLYGDGHDGYLTYPGPFPACREVADCGQRYFDSLPQEQR